MERKELNATVNGVVSVAAKCPINSLMGLARRVSYLISAFNSEYK